MRLLPLLEGRLLLHRLFEVGRGQLADLVAARRGVQEISGQLRVEVQVTIVPVLTEADFAAALPKWEGADCVAVLMGASVRMTARS